LFGRLKSTKKGFDSSVTARSNGTLAFIFNNGNMGVGVWLRDAGRGLQKRLPELPKSPELVIETQIDRLGWNRARPLQS